MFGRDLTQELEIATIERPHRLRLLANHPDLHYELDHVIDAVYGGGCRMMLIFRSRPATPTGRALQPLMSRSWKLHCVMSWSGIYPISRLRSADTTHTEAPAAAVRAVHPAPPSIESQGTWTATPKPCC